MKDFSSEGASYGDLPNQIGVLALLLFVHFLFYEFTLLLTMLPHHLVLFSWKHFKTGVGRLYEIYAYPPTPFQLTSSD